LHAVHRIINPGNPHESNHIAGLASGERLIGWAVLAEAPVLVTETVTDCGEELLSVTELGTEHVDMAGAPLQVSATV